MKDTNIKTLTVVHVNCYTAKLKHKDIISFYEDDKVVRITLTNNYQYEDSSFPRWKAIEPFDKDEITSIMLEFQNGETKNISIPFKNISSSGAYCINEKSKTYEDKSSVTIEWEK